MQLTVYSANAPLAAEVDDSDYDMLKDTKWRLAARGNRKYVLGKIRVDGTWKDMYLHHYLVNKTKGVRVSFKDGNGLNNTRRNLHVQETVGPSKLSNVLVHGPPTINSNKQCVVYTKHMDEILLDEHWWHLLAGRSWYLCEGYAKSGATLMHRVIAQAKTEQTIDHINGNKLDNRECNLRIATRGQQSQNRMKRTVNVVSGYIGVSKQVKGGNWHARVVFQGKTHCLGTYASPIDAAFAYDCKARELYGKHAKTNDIPLSHQITTKM